MPIELQLPVPLTTSRHLVPQGVGTFPFFIFFRRFSLIEQEILHAAADAAYLS